MEGAFGSVCRVRAGVETIPNRALFPSNIGLANIGSFLHQIDETQPRVCHSLEKAFKEQGAKSEISAREKRSGLTRPIASKSKAAILSEGVGV